MKVLVAEILISLSLSWLRLAVALVLSVFSALIVGIAAGVDRRVERAVIPVLDVLQSVPILGFFPIAIYFLATSIPVVGLELASIFLIFTCTFWNIAFGVYEAVRAVPTSVLDVLELSNLGWASRLRKVYIPASIPRIADQLPASLANAFYFLAASEILALGSEELALRGIGSLILGAIAKGDIYTAALSLVAVVLSISAVYLFVINPISSYANKYRFDIIQPPARPPRIVLSHILPAIRLHLFAPIARFSITAQRILPTTLVNVRYVSWGAIRLLAFISLIAGLILLVARVYAELPDVQATVIGILAAAASIGGIPMLEALGFSMMRVAICISLNFAVSLVIVYGLVEKAGRLRDAILPLLQIVASLPAPLVFPLIAPLFEANPVFREAGAILLMSLGTFWYILYSTLGGFTKVHTEYLELAELYKLSGFKKLRYIYLPFAIPSIVTGLLTATGGAWNTIIIAERLGGEGQIFAVTTPGLGKIMSEFAERGDLHALAYTVIVMTLVIVALNRILWRRLYDYAIKALRIHE